MQTASRGKPSWVVCVSGWMPDYFPLTFIRQQWTEGEVVAVSWMEYRFIILKDVGEMLGD